ncbi:uncharacterized protein LOC143513760 [Brachyhypopomus gauderio]|uniref:uncharacterized protein LOC143513760 n=1 Tax=Brachyhypopomus gauderio TaxID=698409 RepID=UPI004041014E
MASENLRSGQAQAKDDIQTLSEQEEMFNTIENLASLMKKATAQIKIEKIKNRELVSEYEKIERKWTREWEEMMNRQKELEEECKTLQDEKRVIEKDRKLMRECLKEMRRMAVHREREDLEKMKLRQEIHFYQVNEKARLKEIKELRQKVEKQVEKMEKNEKIKRELEEREKVRQQEWERERKEVEKMKCEIEQERNRMRDERKREREELTRDKALYRLKIERMVVRAFAKKDAKPEGSEKKTRGRWWKSWKNHDHCRSQESSDNSAELSSCPGRNNPESQSSAGRVKETMKSIWQKWFKR